MRKDVAGINPRLVRWAEVKGLNIDDLVNRKDGEIFMVDDVPWTVEFMAWISEKWAEFRVKCHGNMARGECCAGGPRVHERFDEWLKKDC